MTILHLIRSSAFSSNDLKQCISNIEHYDNVVLLDDGCYNINHPLMKQLQDKSSMINLYIVKDHAQARAVNFDDISKEVLNSITMTELVALTFSNDSVVTWQ
ncbi:MAG: sulfurtransferase complex subunit TusB [Colwellia sp.]|nr:sulfurtransferase complex subunit TusB [Colwellia sp.]